MASVNDEFLRLVYVAMAIIPFVSEPDLQKRQGLASDFFSVTGLPKDWMEMFAVGSELRINVCFTSPRDNPSLL